MPFFQERIILTNFHQELFQHLDQAVIYKITLIFLQNSNSISICQKSVNPLQSTHYKRKKILECDSKNVNKKTRKSLLLAQVCLQMIMNFNTKYQIEQKEISPLNDYHDCKCSETRAWTENMRT